MKSNNITDKISELISSKKGKIYLVVFLCVLLLITIIFSKTEIKAKEEKSEVINYIERTERELSTLLSNVEGAGKVEVLISVESGTETVLATKVVSKENNGVIESEETPIIVNGKTITIKEKYPKIVGVLIVAEGADDLGVKMKLQRATLSVLDVSINQIEILTRK